MEPHEKTVREAAAEWWPLVRGVLVSGGFYLWAGPHEMQYRYAVSRMIVLAALATLFWWRWRRREKPTPWGECVIFVCVVLYLPIVLVAGLIGKPWGLWLAAL